MLSVVILLIVLPILVRNNHGVIANDPQPACTSGVNCPPGQVEDLLNQKRYCSVETVRKDLPLSPSIKHFIDFEDGMFKTEKTQSGRKDSGKKVPSTGNYAHRSFPWVAAIIAAGSNFPGGVGVYTCSGALISSTVILTAGHCFQSIKRAQESHNIEFLTPSDVTYNVLLGYHTFDLTKHTKNYINEKRGDKINHAFEMAVEIDTIVVHKGIDWVNASVPPIFVHPSAKRHLYDLALIRLKKEVDFNLNAYVKPGCLPVISPPSYFGPLEMCRAFAMSGYGPGSLEISIRKPNESCSLPPEKIIPNREFIAEISTFWNAIESSFKRHPLGYDMKNVLLFEGRGKEKTEKLNHGFWCKLKKRILGPGTTVSPEVMREFAYPGWSGSPLQTVMSGHWFIAAVHKGHLKGVSAGTVHHYQYATYVATPELLTWIRKHHNMCVLNPDCRLSGHPDIEVINGYPTDADAIYLD